MCTICLPLEGCRSSVPNRCKEPELAEPTSWFCLVRVQSGHWTWFLVQDYRCSGELRFGPVWTKLFWGGRGMLKQARIITSACQGSTFQVTRTLLSPAPTTINTSNLAVYIMCHVRLMMHCGCCDSEPHWMVFIILKKCHWWHFKLSNPFQYLTLLEAGDNKSADFCCLQGGFQRWNQQLRMWWEHNNTK